MFENFNRLSKWREAVNSGCAGLVGDQVCAGYYRVRHFVADCGPAIQELGAFGPELNRKALVQPATVPNSVTVTTVKAPTWLPVAIWWDEEEDRFICLVDGQEADTLSIWPLCRSFTVTYEAYVHVAEQGGAWPDGLIGGACEHMVCSEPAIPSSGSFASEIAPAANDLATDEPAENKVVSNHISDNAMEVVEPGLISAVSKSSYKDHEFTIGVKSDPASALAGLGHNQEGLSKDQILFETLSDLERDCFAWLDGIGVIQTQKQADQAGAFAEKFSSLEKEAEEARTVEKRPVLDQGRAIDAKWKPIVNSASDGKKRMKRALEPFLIAERERLEEEARRRGDLDDFAFSNPKAGLYDRKISLRSSYVLSIHDEEALRDYFANDKRFWRDKEVRQVFKRLAEADLHAGREVPGAELVQELTAA